MRGMDNDPFSAIRKPAPLGAFCPSPGFWFQRHRGMASVKPDAGLYAPGSTAPRITGLAQAHLSGRHLLPVAALYERGAAALGVGGVDHEWPEDIVPCR